MMKESSNKSDQSISIRNDIPRRVARKQMQNLSGMATITRSLSQTHMISHEDLNETSQSPTPLAGPLEFHLTEITKSNDQRANCSKKI